MEQRLKDVLEGREGNYILPFYWQHGEEEGLLREGMRKIKEAGIGAVCVESRPHPDFVGEGWWRDMDVILAEAKALDMRVWVLDDAHFPSGYANGKVGEDSPYGKILLDYYHIDVCGPMKHGGFIIDLEEGEKLAAVTAGLRNPEKAENQAAGLGEAGKSGIQTAGLSEAGREERLYDIRDLSALVENGILYWDVPEGDWVITVLKITRKGKMRRGYINTLDRAAVRFFIDTVYEPHYARYGELFGNRFAGFFSDEPEIGNASEHYRIGHSQSPLPWCGQLEGMLKERWKEEYGVRLTSLFCEAEGISPRARVEFMEFVTKLYGENFCGQIGDWCRQHGVEYIGHVIEDNGCHARLGLGTGHYFRALMGQDMAGIDVVLQQIRPGYGDGRFHAIGGKGTYDGRFFHYGLAAMGVSLAYLDPKKQGRTMCELYGAYGWAEGLKLMKWLADHMLVRGVNYFVPHAFTMKDFPDRDCPPHFYARGNNPQYPYFGYLMRYINRVSHLIQGGKPLWKVGVLYNACGEWAGAWMPFEVVGKLLTQAQIPYVVIPEEGVDVALFVRGTGSGNAESGGLGSGNAESGAGRVSCQVLVIPFSEYLPKRVLAGCEKAADAGAEVIFLEQMPMVLETGKLYQGKGVVLQEAELVPYLRKLGADGIRCTSAAGALRVFPYRQPEGDFYLCFNESPGETIDTMLSLPEVRGKLWRYDAFDNRLVQVSEQAGEGTERRIRLRLAPYEACILYAGEAEETDVFRDIEAGISCCAHVPVLGEGRERRAEAGRESVSGCGAEFAGAQAQQDLSSAQNALMAHELCLEKGWKLTLWEAGKNQPLRTLAWDTLMDVTSPKNYPDFSGTMEYEVFFDCAEEEGFIDCVEEDGFIGCAEGDGFIGCAEGDGFIDCAKEDGFNGCGEDENFIGCAEERDFPERFKTGKEVWVEIDCGEVGEIMEVWLNGVSLGVRITPPYHVRGKVRLKRKGNLLRVRVVNTLVHQQRDRFSRSLPMEPSGLLGPVRIWMTGSCDGEELTRNMQ